MVQLNGSPLIFIVICGPTTFLYYVSVNRHLSCSASSPPSSTLEDADASLVLLSSRRMDAPPHPSFLKDGSPSSHFAISRHLPGSTPDSPSPPS